MFYFWMSNPILPFFTSSNTPQFPLMIISFRNSFKRSAKLMNTFVINIPSKKKKNFQQKINHLAKEMRNLLNLFNLSNRLKTKRESKRKMYCGALKK